MARWGVVSGEAPEHCSLLEIIKETVNEFLIKMHQPPFLNFCLYNSLWMALILDEE